MSSLVDGATFAELRRNAGSDFVRELVATFAEELPGMLGELRDALGEADAARFRRTAHALKSNSLSFGALPLAELARALELGGLPSDRAAVESLAELAGRSAAALQEAANDG